MPEQPRRRFHQQLADIDVKVLRLFALVTEAIAAATDALLADDTDAARALSERDELVDELEADVEALTERELLRESPMGVDMRYLISVLRVVPELERSGDLAEHIASRAAAGLGPTLSPAVRGLLEEMGSGCVAMWRQAADAWTERDAEAASKVDEADDELDVLHDRLVVELHGGDVDLPHALQATLVARFYERLGDHAVHISERVRYLATGL